MNQLKSKVAKDCQRAPDAQSRSATNSQLQFRHEIANLSFGEQLERVKPPKPLLGVIQAKSDFDTATPAMASGQPDVQFKRAKGSEIWDTDGNKTAFKTCRDKGKKLFKDLKDSCTNDDVELDTLTAPDTEDEDELSEWATEQMTAMGLTHQETEVTYDDDFDEQAEYEVSIDTVGTVASAKHDGKKPMYSNTFCPVNGTMEASMNFRRGYGKTSSEVLWAQWRIATAIAVQKNWFSEDPGMKFEEIKRKGVINKTSGKIARLCSSSDAAFVNEWAFQPDSEEFFALLKTPNAQSAAFMLVDHNRNLGAKKTIAEIRFKGNKSPVGSADTDALAKAENDGTDFYFLDMWIKYAAPTID